MMKLIGGIPTIDFAYLPDLLVIVRTLFFSIQFQLNRTLYVFTEFSPLIIYISFDWHNLPSPYAPTVVAGRWNTNPLKEIIKRITLPLSNENTESSNA